MATATELSLECIHTFSVEADPSEYTNTINAVAISPNNQKIVAVGDKFRGGRIDANRYTFTMWDLGAGEKTDIASATGYKPHTADLVSVAFSTDSRSIMVGSKAFNHLSEDISLSTWSIENILSYTGHTTESGWILAIIPHPSENTFAACGYNKIQIWQGLVRAGDFRQVQSWESHTACTMMFSPDGQRLYSGGMDGHIRLWEASSGELIKTFDKQDYLIRSLVFSQDGQTIISGSDQRIKIWDASTGEVKHSFFAHPDWIRDLTVTADDRFLLSAGDTRVKIWDLETGEPSGTIEAHDNLIRSMVLSRDGTILVTGDRQGVVKVWKLKL